MPPAASRAPVLLSARVSLIRLWSPMSPPYFPRTCPLSGASFPPRGPCLCLGRANLSIAPELLLHSGCLGAGCRFFPFCCERGCHLPRDSTPISRPGFKQLSDRHLL